MKRLINIRPEWIEILLAILLLIMSCVIMNMCSKDTRAWDYDNDISSTVDYYRGEGYTTSIEDGYLIVRKQNN